MEQERRVNYKNNRNTSNLSGEENLIVFNYVLTIIGLQCSLE